jgi:CRISPR-associated endonuclease/helicase Cas3
MLERGWHERRRLEIGETADEQRQWLIVDKWRDDATTEFDRSAGRPQALAEHQAWTEGRARVLAATLRLPLDLTEMLAIAARRHDEGKRQANWQLAANAPPDGAPYAKTRGPFRPEKLHGYRHEFGSLPLVGQDPDFSRLSPDLQDLALHLVAAHHGGARPHIATQGCDDAPPSVLAERAVAVALRFARLQRRWGPWGLAWWEALLRAADQQASRENDEQEGA